MEVFINNGIEVGIKLYMMHTQTNKDPIEIENLYEFFIIKTLVLIYGDVDIVNNYKINKPEVFIEKLSRYGYPKEKVNDFLNNVSKYNSLITKTIDELENLPNEINKSLIDMIAKKVEVTNIPDNELAQYRKLFGLEENECFTRLNNVVNKNTKETVDYYKLKELSFNNDFTYTEKKPRLLHGEVYRQYGFNAKDFKDKNYFEVEEINEKIEKDGANTGQQKSNAFTLELTTGSGFVDTLVILSVMATEIFIGILIMISRLK